MNDCFTAPSRSVRILLVACVLTVGLGALTQAHATNITCPVPVSNNTQKRYFLDLDNLDGSSCNLIREDGSDVMIQVLASVGPTPYPVTMCISVTHLDASDSGKEYEIIWTNAGPGSLNTRTEAFNRAGVIWLWDTTGFPSDDFNCTGDTCLRFLRNGALLHGPFQIPGLLTDSVGVTASNVSLVSSLLHFFSPADGFLRVQSDVQPVHGGFLCRLRILNESSNVVGFELAEGGGFETLTCPTDQINCADVCCDRQDCTLNLCGGLQCIPSAADCVDPGQTCGEFCVNTDFDEENCGGCSLDSCNLPVCVGGNFPGINCPMGTECLGGGACMDRCTGPNSDVMCTTDADCPDDERCGCPETCRPSRCTNSTFTCDNDADCPGGSCAPVCTGGMDDDMTCNPDAGCPDGEVCNPVCTNGGPACTVDTDCPAGETCGTCSGLDGGECDCPGGACNTSCCLGGACSTCLSPRVSGVLDPAEEIEICTGTNHPVKEVLSTITSFCDPSVPGPCQLEATGARGMVNLLVADRSRTLSEDAPSLSLSRIELSDIASVSGNIIGNGNGLAEPGEKVALFITVNNAGGGSVPASTATLTALPVCSGGINDGMGCSPEADCPAGEDCNPVCATPGGTPCPSGDSDCPGGSTCGACTGTVGDACECPGGACIRTSHDATYPEILGTMLSTPPSSSCDQEVISLPSGVNETPFFVEIPPDHACPTVRRLDLSFEAVQGSVEFPLSIRCPESSKATDPPDPCEDLFKGSFVVHADPESISWTRLSRKAFCRNTPTACFTDIDCPRDIPCEKEPVVYSIVGGDLRDLRDLGWGSETVPPVGVHCLATVQDNFARSSNFARTCVGGSDEGKACATNRNCDGGICSLVCRAVPTSCSIERDCPLGTNCVDGDCRATPCPPPMNCSGPDCPDPECPAGTVYLGEVCQCPPGTTCGPGGVCRSITAPTQNSPICPTNTTIESKSVCSSGPDKGSVCNEAADCRGICGRFACHGGAEPGRSCESSQDTSCPPDTKTGAGICIGTCGSGPTRGDVCTTDDDCETRCIDLTGDPLESGDGFWFLVPDPSPLIEEPSDRVDYCWCVLDANDDCLNLDYCVRNDHIDCSSP